MYNILKGKNYYIQLQRSHPNKRPPSPSETVRALTTRSCIRPKNHQRYIQIFCPLSNAFIFHFTFQAHLIWITGDHSVSNALCHKSSLFPWVFFLPRKLLFIEGNFTIQDQIQIYRFPDTWVWNMQICQEN